MPDPNDAGFHKGLDELSVLMALRAGAGTCAALALTTATARIALSAGVWQIELLGGDPTVLVAIKTGDGTVTSPAIPTTGNTSVHTRLLRGDQVERVRLTADGGLYLAALLSSGSGTLYCTRICD
jgi:hypothetical protein